MDILKKHLLFICFVLPVNLFCQVDSSFSQKGLQVFSICLTESNKYFGTNYGILKITNAKDKIDTSKFAYKNTVFYIANDLYKDFWLGTKNNMVVKLNDPSIITSFNSNYKNTIIKSIAIEKRYMWVSTNDGRLYMLNKNAPNISCYNFLEQLKDTVVVNSIFIDNENTKWLGTDRGIYILEDGLITKPSTRNTPDFPVNVIKAYKDTIWVGGYGRLSRLNNQKNEWELLFNSNDEDNKLIGEEKSIKNINDMAFDSYGNLWIASEKIACYDINKNWEIINREKNYNAISIAIENDSIIWFGTACDGIFFSKVKPVNSKSQGNNLFLLVDNSGTMKKRTLNKVRKTLTMWLDYMGSDDKISVLSTIRVPCIERETIRQAGMQDTVIERYKYLIKDTFLINTTAKNKEEIIKVFDNRKDSVLIDSVSERGKKNRIKVFDKTVMPGVGKTGHYGEKIYSTIKLTDDYIFEGANNRFIVTTDCGFDPTVDSLKDIVSKYYENSDLHFSIISYKKFRKPESNKNSKRKISDLKRTGLEKLTYSGNGRLYTIFDSKSYIFHKEFGTRRSRSTKLYIIAKSGVLKTKIYYTSYLQFAEKGKLDEKSKKINEYFGGLDLGYVFYDYSDFKLGAFMGYEYNYYTTSFIADSYKNSYRTVDDISTTNDSLTKMIDAKNISESISLSRHYFTPKFKLMVQFGNKFEAVASFGLKLLFHSNNTFAGKGTYTYKGAYDEYGGMELPFHDLPEYGYYTDTTFVHTGVVDLNQSWWLNPFMSIGASFKTSSSSKFKIFANFTANYTTYDWKNNLNDYQLSKEAGDYNSVLLTKKYKQAFSWGFEAGIAWKLSK